MSSIKLSEIRTNLKDVKCSFCGIVKQLYALKDDCKELAVLLPKDKKTFLTMGETVCKAMGVGETYGVKVRRVRKLSVDLVLRYLVSHQATISVQVVNAAKKAKDEKAA